MANSGDKNDEDNLRPDFDEQKILEIMNSASSPEEAERLFNEIGMPTSSSRKIDDPEMVARMKEFMKSADSTDALPADLEDKLFSSMNVKNEKLSSGIQEVDITATLSDEVQEIMGYIPNWITRWGITSLGIFIAVFLLGTWFVKYPDIISAQVVITSSNPSTYLRANTSGKLTHLLIENNQRIQAGQYLAVIENTADYQIILGLKPKLERLRFLLSDNSRFLNVLQFERSHKLGELQAEYESFLSSLREYERFIEAGYLKNKIVSVRSRRTSTYKYTEELSKQINILQEELTLTQQNHERMAKLYGDNLISQSEFAKSQTTLLQTEYSLIGANNTRIQAQIQMTLLDESVLDLEFENNQQQDNLISEVRRATESLQSGILSYEKIYVLISPVNGVASLTDYWSENQNIAIGDDVMAIVSSDTSNIIGKIKLPLQGSGKVHEGQLVNVKLINYPHQEFGMIRGILQSISLVPFEDFYVLTVHFPNGLETTYGKKLYFSHEMRGTAEIITADYSLFDRMLNLTRSYLD